MPMCFLAISIIALQLGASSGHTADSLRKPTFHDVHQVFDANLVNVLGSTSDGSLFVLQSVDHVAEAASMDDNSPMKLTWRHSLTGAVAGRAGRRGRCAIQTAGFLHEKQFVYAVLRTSQETADGISELVLYDTLSDRLLASLNIPLKDCAVGYESASDHLFFHNVCFQTQERPGESPTRVLVYSSQTLDASWVLKHPMESALGSHTDYSSREIIIPLPDEEVSSPADISISSVTSQGALGCFLIQTRNSVFIHCVLRNRIGHSTTSTKLQEAGHSECTIKGIQYTFESEYVISLSSGISLACTVNDDEGAGSISLRSFEDVDKVQVSIHGGRKADSTVQESFLVHRMGNSKALMLTFRDVDSYGENIVHAFCTSKPPQNGSIFCAVRTESGDVSFGSIDLVDKISNTVRPEATVYFHGHRFDGMALDVPESTSLKNSPRWRFLIASHEYLFVLNDKGYLYKMNMADASVMWKKFVLPSTHDKNNDFTAFLHVCPDDAPQSASVVVVLEEHRGEKFIIRAVGVNIESGALNQSHLIVVDKKVAKFSHTWESQSPLMKVVPTRPCVKFSAGLVILFEDWKQVYILFALLNTSFTSGEYVVEEIDNSGQPTVHMQNDKSQTISSYSLDLHHYSLVNALSMEVYVTVIHARLAWRCPIAECALYHVQPIQGLSHDHPNLLEPRDSRYFTHDALRLIDEGDKHQDQRVYLQHPLGSVQCFWRIHNATLCVHLVDGLTGSTIHIETHSSVMGDVSMTTAENLVVYSFISEENMRPVLAAIEVLQPLHLSSRSTDQPLYSKSLPSITSIFRNARQERYVHSFQAPRIFTYEHTISEPVVSMEVTSTAGGHTPKSIVILLSTGSVVHLPLHALRRHNGFQYTSRSQHDQLRKIFTVDVGKAPMLACLPSRYESTSRLVFVGPVIAVHELCTATTFDRLNPNINYLYLHGFVMLNVILAIGMRVHFGKVVR